MNAPLSFAKREERKRWFVSGGLTLGFYALALAAGLFFSILNPEEEAFSNTTVLINLPGPITNSIGLGSVTPSDEGETALTAKAPAAEAPAPKAAKTELPKAPEPAPKAAAAAPAPQQATAAPALPAVDAAVSEPAPSVPAATAPAAQQAAAAEPWVPGQREQGSRVSDTSSMLYVPGRGDVPWTGSTTNIHKAEKGSSSDTTLGGAQGTVGHNLYTPIYLSLPPPRQVSASIYNAIPDQISPPNIVINSAQARKKAFLLYYEFDGSGYRLKADVPVEQRDRLWDILEDAGYDIVNADFKKEGLSPVVIGFTVTRDKQVKGVEVLQSSGDPAIDKAVLYGFKQAAFWNKTGETVPGRFTYRF